VDDVLLFDLACKAQSSVHHQVVSSVSRTVVQGVHISSSRASWASGTNKN